MLKSDFISYFLIVCVLFVPLFSYVPAANAESDLEDELNQYLRENINLQRVSKAGEKIEEGGTRLRRSTHLSWAATGTSIFGSFFSIVYDSPEIFFLTGVGSLGFSLWSQIEELRAQSALREGGAELKGSVNTAPAHSW